MLQSLKKFDLREFLTSVAVALIIAILIRSFVFEPFRIPSASMYPSLNIGDVLLVNKSSYGYSRHSLPWSVPVIMNRIFYSQPHRGDVVVIKLPDHPKRFFIKRIIGLPNDRVMLKAGNLYINGQPIAREYLGKVQVKYPQIGYLPYVSEYQETLEDGRTYKTWSLESFRDQTEFPSSTQEYVVPADHFFLMGDNRDNSADSRYLSELGFIHRDNILGKASIVVFSLNSFNRILKVIR